MARSAEQWKQPSCLGYVEDYTAQLCGDYKRPWHKDSYETTGTYDGKYPAVFFLRQTVSLRVPGTNSLAPYKTNELFLLHPFFNFQGKGAEFKSFQNWMTGSMVKKIYCILPHWVDSEMFFFHRKNRWSSAIKGTKHIPEQKTSWWKIDFVFFGCSVFSAFSREFF